MVTRKSRSVLKLRHPLECLPTRPVPRPSWEPTAREVEISEQDNCQGLRQVWNEPRLKVGRDFGPIRINFRISSYAPVAASFSGKAQRDVYFEGNHETHGFRRHEIDPCFLDLLYQPCTLTWIDSKGQTRSMTFDYLVETDHNKLIVGEDKATDAFFEVPQFKADLGFAERYFGQFGIALERRIKGGHSGPVMQRVVKDIFDNRRSTFTAEQAQAVRVLLGRARGQTSFRTLLQCIGGPTPQARRQAHAMMHQRIISLPLNVQAMPDTPVTTPKKATKFALREFLQFITDREAA